jgi:hypothetical protein
MEMMIRFLYLSIIFFLIAWVVIAEEITTGNLLPNGSASPSNYQSVDSSIPNVTTNGFTVEGNIRDWGQELETTGTGNINYTGSLIDIITNGDTTTQQKLNNGITLDSTTIVQNCEFVGSNWQCGQATQGQDTYTTKIKILDSDGNVLAEVNQVRNNDAGYGNNAFKYEDQVIYTGSGSNQFYWEWEGVDVGYDTYGTNLGGPNLLGAKLTMTYDNEVLDEEIIEEIGEIIEQFEEWEQFFEDPQIIEEILPIPLVIEELLPILEEEEFFEVLETQQTLEEEFEEVEILNVLEEEVNEENISQPENKETNTAMSVQEESISEESNEGSQTASTGSPEESPKLVDQEKGDDLDQNVNDDPKVKVNINMQNIEKQVAKTVKAIDQQLAVTNILGAQLIEKDQVDLSSYYKEYTDPRIIYPNKSYEDLIDLDQYNTTIYGDNRMIKVAMNDPLYKYQESIRQARLKRVILEQELRKLQGR